MNSADNRLPLSKKLTELDPQARFAPGLETVAHLNSIYPVSRETILRLAIYNALLNKWQKKTNLVAPGTLREYWSRHVADSLQVLAVAKEENGDLPVNWIDIGSGGGFPGLVIAIVLSSERDGSNRHLVTLIESIQKKCAFLRRVILECGINQNGEMAKVACERIESATERFVPTDIITARALAPLDKLLEFTGDYLSTGDSGKRRALFHKGREFDREIRESRGKWEFDLLVHPSKVDPESVILEIYNVARLE